MTADVVDDLRTVRDDISDGVARTLDALEAATAALSQADPDIQRARERLVSATQSLSFEDRCGQRLTRAINALTGVEETRAEADLLHGPQNGPAPSQDEIDALFG